MKKGPYEPWYYFIMFAHSSTFLTSSSPIPP